MPGEGGSDQAHNFLRVVAEFTQTQAKNSSTRKPIRLGLVDYDYDPTDFLGGINPRILFDGEGTVSQKRYPVMAGYYPIPGARVVLVPVGTTYLILGTVDTKPQDPRVDIFTTTDTWEKPTGARLVRVQVQGGGAGGGGSSAGSSTTAGAGGGGGGGGYAESYISANAVDSSITVTVGAGGAGGTAGANDGSPGGASSFGSLVAANGGSGGEGSTATAVRDAVAGGTGGTITAGDLQIQGGDGGCAFILTGEVVGASYGGDSSMANNRRSTATMASNAAGTSGYTYGGGGGGGVSGRQSSGATAVAGGAGAAGIVIVTTYF